MKDLIRMERCFMKTQKELEEERAKDAKTLFWQATLCSFLSSSIVFAGLVSEYEAVSRAFVATLVFMFLFLAIQIGSKK